MINWMIITISGYPFDDGESYHIEAKNHSIAVQIDGLVSIS